MSGYAYTDTGDRVFVVQTTRIAVQDGNGGLAYLTAEGTDRTTNYNDLVGRPQIFAPILGTTKDTAKAGNWLPVWKDVKDADKAVAALIKGKVETIKVLTYNDTPEAVVDRFNELLTALRA